MIAEKLRRAVIQKAIEGNLFNIESEDKLIEPTYNTKKFYKKEKIYSEFSIPKNWIWTTLSRLFDKEQMNDGDWIVSNDMSQTEEIKLIQLGSIGKGKFINKEFKHISNEKFNELKCKEIRPNYLLFNRIVGGGINACIIPENIDGKLITSVDALWIKPSSNINLKFIMYLLLSPYLENQINKLKAGTTRQRISKLNLINIPIPLPNIKIQNIIVEKLEILLAEIDRLEQDEKALKELEDKFPVRLKKSLLKSAIGGNFSKINLEYENKVDKLKYQNNESLNEVESLLGKINHNWIVTNLKQIADISTGRKDANHAKQNGIYRFYTCAKEYFMSDTFSFEGESLILPGNGANVGQVYRYSGKFEAYQRTYIIRVKSNFYQYIDMNYLEYLFHAYWGEYNKDKMFGSATPYIKLGNLVNFPVVIPPIDEQKRIVEKLDKLFAIDLLNI